MIRIGVFLFVVIKMIRIVVFLFVVVWFFLSLNPVSFAVTKRLPSSNTPGYYFILRSLGSATCAMILLSYKLTLGILFKLIVMF